ncbi:MAG: hypothetical protein RJA77_957, partial [Pseudomonadota bacterium]
IARGVCPLIVITRLAPHVDHCIDGGAATKHPTSRIVDASATEPWVGLCLEAPVCSGVGDGVEVAHGNLDPVPVVLTARFNEQDAVFGVSTQPIGEQAASTARPYDDAVKFHANRVDS